VDYEEGAPIRDFASIHRIKMVSLKCSFIGSWRIEPKLKDEIKTGEQHEALKQTVCAAGASPDPICRSLTVAWRAGPTVRIRSPPAGSLVQT